MSQVPVKWVYETFDEKPPEIKAGKKYVLRATGDMDIVPHAVVPLEALREVVEGLVQINTEMHFIKQNNQGGYVGDKEACRRAAAIAQRLLASLGEQ